MAVLTSRVRHEEMRIFAALEQRKIPYVHIDARRLHLELKTGPPPWPVVLNREISYSRALYAGYALQHMGATAVNSVAAIEVCGDKWRTAMALQNAGLPVPRTTLALTPEAARAAADEQGYPLVTKPLTSSWGRHVSLIPDARVMETVSEMFASFPSPLAHILCVQEPIDKPDRDIRVIVIGGQPIGAMYRKSDSWRTNVARGARPEICQLTDDIAKLAIGAAAATKAEIAGVDLLEGPSGELYVLEVNHGVEFSGFTQASGIDVADAIAGYLLTREKQ